jgi:small-conductance mechanosensitive channel
MKSERLSGDEGRRYAKAMVLKAEKQRRSTKLFITVMTCVAVLAFVAVTILAAIYVPQVAIYVPVIALALALALQKYTASFFSFFVITFSKIYDIGDRIRIGNTKGDVRHIGLLHTTLEEVGEDEKLGGELTGRLLYVPNLIILDQPVLNYSKDYSTGLEAISSDYMFDEVRIPITTDSNVEKASQLLESILKSQDEVYVRQAGQVFQNGYPRFLDEAMSGPRVLIFVEPQHIWIKGKFVAPLESRNDLRSSILLQFIKEAKASSDIKLA